jgi:hypothetical protein
MTVIGGLQNFSLPKGYKLGDGIGSGKNDLLGKLADELKAEASKTPIERTRDAVLKKRGLSEDDYKQLPQDDRDAIDLEVREALRQAVDQSRAKEEARGVRYA